VLSKNNCRWPENASINGTIAEFTAVVCKGTASKRTTWNKVNSAVTEKKCNTEII
jgi:hypothetical protein